jgi:filamentous hemagglutinin
MRCADPTFWAGADLPPDALPAVSLVVKTVRRCYSYQIMPILRNARIAVVQRAKLTRYCLDPTHEDGRHKARVFQAALGFDQANAADLISAIRTGIMSHEAEHAGETAHGSLWRVDVLIAGPGGIATVRTGWIYEKGKDVPRFTTAYVLGRR